MVRQVKSNVTIQREVSRTLSGLIIVACVAIVVAQARGDDAIVSRGDAGRLEYQQDKRGNRLPDFSHCGYAGANRGVPKVRSTVVVGPSKQDDTRRIQAAIDYVSQLPTDEEGRRGAVLLSQGEFNISGQLKIRASGVVLRGHGAGGNGTTLRATGPDRRSLIRVVPPKPTKNSNLNDRGSKILNEIVPAGKRKVQLDSTEGLAVGTRVEVTHPSSKAWIEKLKVERLGWREGTRDIRWLRTISAIDGSRIELDVPLTLAIEKAVCQATLRIVDSASRLQEIGIEDLALVSDFEEQNAKDEEHAWYGVHMQGVEDAWVRRVQFRHFAGGAVMLGDETSRVTVSDCASYDPVSEIGGYRRHTYFTLGQQCLFLRCWSDNGLHDFSVGHCAAGPNAFVNCIARNALGDSGPRESCATGVLYDNVRIEGNDLNLTNRWNSPPKAGWSAINCLLWQCQAANVRCDHPPVGSNWAIGLWATPAGDGHFSNLSEFVKPMSLYQQQLNERVGDEAAKRAGPFLLKPVGATNPSVEQAKKFSAQSAMPARQLIHLIKTNWQIKRPSNTPVPRLEDVDSAAQTSDTKPASFRVEIQNGWLTASGQLMTGDLQTPMWWRGDLLRERAKTMGPAVTRFAPGRHGTGLTDDLEVVARRMAQDDMVAYDHHYGLWYDRRRDDHLMVRRANGEVVPPFYEQPFARAGEGTAWDGLSRFDLTKFNHWYWSRLSQFARLGEQHGFVLFHHNYFQHNILEAGAHWADSPWRPANNVNVTGLPEPPPYVGDKRIFLAEHFYDVSNAKLRKLHRNYIRQCLDIFAERRNVIQLTSGEYTGPLSFVQFWVDTIAEWEAENGQSVAVALSCTKDVQDAILADSGRSRHVDVIDIRYWTYTEDGELYAPPGGKHLSPRQHLRQLKPATTSFASVVRSIREYRREFPDKAVTYNAHIHCRAKRDGWAVLMGGGSLPNTPMLPPTLSEAIVKMRPNERIKLEEGQWCLSHEDRAHLIYSRRTQPTPIQLEPGTDWEWCSVNPKSGRAESFKQATNAVIPVDHDTKIIWARRIE